MSARFTYLVRALGCKVNQYEAQEFREQLGRLGGSEAQPGAPATVVVLHTCAVTGRSAAKCRAELRRLRAAHPAALIALTGCLPELQGALPGADLVLGTGAAGGLGAAIAANLEIHPPGVHMPGAGVSCIGDHARAWVKIQDGCTAGCAYCIVPRVRPRLWSKEPTQAVAEVRRLWRTGHHEVVLCGIHLGFYGRTQGDALGIAPLLRLLDALAQGPEPGRLRLSSIEPMEVSPDLVGRLGSGRVCPHLHLPIQSGSSRVLRAMGRPYRAEDIGSLLSSLRATGAAISTDLIAGLPGETEDDHAATKLLLDTHDFIRAHVFPYSRRPGTRAADMPQCPAGSATRRAHELMEAARASRRRALARLVGRECDVLWEHADRNGTMHGTTGEYAQVTTTGTAQAGAIERRTIKSIAPGDDALAC